MGKLILLVVLGLVAVGGVVGGATCACSESETVDVPDAGPLLAPGVLRGVALTRAGGREVPAAGARVRLDGSPFTVAADASGLFELPGMRPGTWSLLVTHEQAALRLDGVALAGADGTAESRDLGRVVLDAVGSLSGVVSRAGAPVADALVVVDLVGDARTGADGAFSFAGLVAGEHRVAVVAPDGTSVAPLVTVDAGKPATVALDLDTLERIETGAVAGRLVVPPGRSELLVRSGPRVATVSADGSFFLNLRAGVHTLQIVGTGVRTTSLPFLVVAGGRALGDLFVLAGDASCANGGRPVGTATDEDSDTTADADEPEPCLCLAGAADADADGLCDSLDRDVDADGIDDVGDNCPADANAEQADLDGDLQGDACDADADGDEVDDAGDNCLLVANAEQADLDGDLQGDACDADADGDGLDDAGDNCPLVANADQADLDGDLQGDACDADADGDEVDDAGDNCPLVANADQADTDGDGAGDACDPPEPVDPCVGAWCLETPLPAGFSWQHVAASGTDVWLATDGVVTHFDGAVWNLVSVPANGAVAALERGARTWLATTDGVLLASQGGAFAVVDDTLADSYRALHELDDGTLLAAVGDGTGDLVVHDATGARREAGFTTDDVVAFDGPAAAPWAVTATSVWQRLAGTWTQVADVPLEPGDALRTLWTDGASAMLAGAAVTGDLVALHFDGTAWTRRTVPFASPHALDAADSDSAWIVLDDGALLAWDGTDWRFEALPGDALRDLVVVSPTEAWSVGVRGRVERHDGTAWSSVRGEQRFTAIRAIGGGAADLWLAGDRGGLFRFDGTALTPASAPTSLTPVALDGVGSDLWLLAERSVLHHFDGTTWARVTLPATTTLDVLDAGAGLVVLGGDGALLRGDGTTWQDDSASFAGTRVTTLLALAATELYAATTDAAAASSIARFDGTAWSTETLPDATSPVVAFAHDGGVVWALARGGRVFERSVDAGWTEVAQLASTAMVAVTRTSPTLAVAVDAQGQLFDWDGVTWSAGVQVAAGPVTALWAAGDELFVAGREVRRRSAGTWSALQTGPFPADEPRVLSARAHDDVWLAGRAEDVRHFDGATWSVRPIPAFCTVSALRSTGADEAFAACGRAVWRWSAGTWANEHAAVSELVDLLGVSGAELFATTSAGTVLRRVDGVWSEEPTGLTLGAAHLAAGAATTWLLDDAGTLARRVDGAWSVDPHVFAAAPRSLLVVTEGPEEVLYVGCEGGVVERFANGAWTTDRAAGEGAVVGLVGDGADVRALLVSAGGRTRIERRNAGLWSVEAGPGLSAARLLAQGAGGDAWAAGPGLVWRWRAP